MRDQHGVLERRERRCKLLLRVLLLLVADRVSPGQGSEWLSGAMVVMRPTLS